MAASVITLKLTPTEYRTIRHELDVHLLTLKAQYQVAVDGGWSHNTDGKSLASRRLAVKTLLDTI